MWVANFADGGSMSAKQCDWTDLPQDRPISGVQLVHSLSRLFISLQGMKSYYYVREAVATAGQRMPTIISEAVGGLDPELGIGIELRLDLIGSAVACRHFKSDRFKYDKGILRLGKNGQAADERRQST